MNEQRRVRVTGPRSRRPRRMSVASQIDERTQVGEIYMRALIRSQFRLALGVAGILVATVGLLPLALRSSWLTGTRVWGVPLPWVLLGAGVYPLLLLLAIGYVRRAEHNEQAFHDLVHPAASGRAATRPARTDR